MTNLKPSLQKLHMSIAVLVIITIANVFIMIMNVSPKQEQKVQTLWVDTFQSQLDNIHQSLSLIEEKMEEIKANNNSDEKIANSIINGTESSIALILDTVETRKKKFNSLHEKIEKINADVSLLQSEFSDIEKNLKNEQD